jgi:nitric oxide reductase NorD protein
VGFWSEPFELEESVGRCWHRLVGASPSMPRFPDAAQTLDGIRGSLAVFFRALGGPPGVGVAAISEARSAHRLSFRQSLGMAVETMEQSRLSDRALLLPPRIDRFPDALLNRDAYFWLVLFLAHHRPAAVVPPRSPLAADLAALRAVLGTIEAVLASCPGMAARYRALGTALSGLRPSRRLPPVEAQVEAVVLRLLGQGDGGDLWPVVAKGSPSPAEPGRYRPFLPVLLWGERDDRATDAAEASTDDTGRRGTVVAAPDVARPARRQAADQARRPDSLILNRFEKILSVVQSLNINRSLDDDDPDKAAKALDDADEIGLAAAVMPATRLAFDLDLPPVALGAGAIAAEKTYPEWDGRRHRYLPDHCRVVAMPARLVGEPWRPDQATRRLIRSVRRQFEALHPRRQLVSGQLEGDELDLEAVVRRRCDMVAMGSGTDRIACARRPRQRDLATTLLVDVSLSTDSWIDNRRVLDVEKDAVVVLAHGLAACGDDYAILTFTSRRRQWVRVETVKDFDEPFGAPVLARIAALRPGFYTRIGAALRHATAELLARSNRHRLLVVLTDGKPNDLDHYEGRHGIEDTRRAIREARAAGVAVFGVTVDRKAQDYFPCLFGPGGYAILDDIARLPVVLPKLYQRLSAGL